MWLPHFKSNYFSTQFVYSTEYTGRFILVLKEDWYSKTVIIFAGKFKGQAKVIYSRISKMILTNNSEINFLITGFRANVCTWRKLASNKAAPLKKLQIWLLTRDMHNQKVGFQGH